jgi:hypothetical protein
MAIDPISPIVPRPIASAVSPEAPEYVPGRAVIAGSMQADSMPVIPAALDVEGSIREASAQISRTAQPEGPMPVDISAAALSYAAESAAQDQTVVQQQSDGVPAPNNPV